MLSFSFCHFPVSPFSGSAGAAADNAVKQTVDILRFFGDDDLFFITAITGIAAGLDILIW